MEEQRECSVFIDLVDKDLEMVTIQINHMIDFVQTVRAEALREEQNLRTSISMISHDMRTPLTSVIGYLQLAKKNCKEKETLQDIEIALDRANYLSYESRGITPTFEQADDTIWVWADNSRSNEGSGLGLYICRKFIEDMNGTISAESDNEVFQIEIELDVKG